MCKKHDQQPFTEAQRHYLTLMDQECPDNSESESLCDLSSTDRAKPLVNGLRGFKYPTYGVSAFTDRSFRGIWGQKPQMLPTQRSLGTPTRPLIAIVIPNGPNGLGRLLLLRL